jgi:hypothetical protein
MAFRGTGVRHQAVILIIRSMTPKNIRGIIREPFQTFFSILLCVFTVTFFRLISAWFGAAEKDWAD